MLLIRSSLIHPSFCSMCSTMYSCTCTYLHVTSVSFSAHEAQKKSSGQEHPFAAAGVCCSRYEEHLQLLLLYSHNCCHFKVWYFWRAVVSCNFWSNCCVCVASHGNGYKPDVDEGWDIHSYSHRCVFLLRILFTLSILKRRKENNVNYSEFFLYIV